MLFIESLEIDDHVPDKIEAKHDIGFNEVEEACTFEGGRLKKAAKNYIRYSARLMPAGTFLLY